MNKNDILILIDKANKKFGVNIKLVGSWQTKGHSNHDVDVYVKEWNKESYNACKYIFKRINQHLDVWYKDCIPNKTNYFFCTDGREGFVKDVPKLNKECMF